MLKWKNNRDFSLPEKHISLRVGPVIPTSHSIDDWQADVADTAARVHKTIHMTFYNILKEHSVGNMWIVGSTLREIF